MRCGNCHAEVNPQEICPVCGKKLEEDDYNICPRCHKYNEEKGKCPHCGLEQSMLSQEYVDALAQGKSEEDKKKIAIASNINKIGVILAVIIAIIILYFIISSILEY